MLLRKLDGEGFTFMWQVRDRCLPVWMCLSTSRQVIISLSTEVAEGKKLTWTSYWQEGYSHNSQVQSQPPLPTPPHQEEEGPFFQFLLG